MNGALDSENDIGGSDKALTIVKCKSHSKGSNGASFDMCKRDSDVSINSGSPAGAAPTANVYPLREVSSPRLNEWNGGLQETQQASASPSLSSELQRAWKEELYQELERKREEMRKQLAANSGRTSSPKGKLMQRHRDHLSCPTPTK